MPKGLDYIINLKDGDFGGISHARTEVETLDNAVEKTHGGFLGLGEAAGRVGEIVAGAFAVEKIVEFGKESREAFLKSEAAAAQVNVAIQKTGGIAGQSLNELREKAEALENVTLFGDEDTLGADSLLLTFTNIRGKIFDEAIPAIQDLAQRMGGDGPADLKGASIQVGKALNDPITGINALRRVGVSFSDEQRKMIEVAVEHGHVQKAQAIILKELNTEFGGSAIAARQVLGPAGDLAHQIDELKKGVGKFINEGLSVVIPMLFSAEHGIETLYHTMQDGYHWVKQNADIFKALGIAAGVAGAGFLAANPAIIAYAFDTGVAAVTSTALSIASGVLTAAQWALNIAMEANPIGLIVTGIGALVGGFYLAYQRSETLRAALSGIGGVAVELLPIFKGLGEMIVGALMIDPEMVKKGFSDSVDGVKKIIADGGISGAFNKAYDTSISESRKRAAADNAVTEVAKKPTETASTFHTEGKGQDKPYNISTGKHGKHSGDESTTLSGGRSVRNVQVTIGKLVEKIELHTTNIQGMGAHDLKRRLTEILTEAVHDSELALGSQ